MKMKTTQLVLAASLLLPFCAQWSRAQTTFRIDSTTVADGQTSVPATDSIYVYFSRKLPFNSLFTKTLHWEPRTAARRDYIFLDADRTQPLFVITHLANTDYSMFAFGARAENGNRMERPFTVNYSTTDNIGQRSVSGSVAFGDRLPSGRANSDLAGLVSRSMAQHLTNDEASGKQFLSFESFSSANSWSGSRTASGAADDVTRTVVLLLDAFETNTDIWSVASAAAIELDGSYAFNFVRPGIYYPVAINYADDDGSVIGAYGYYDANGDFSPDRITVDDTNDLSDIDLTLYSYNAASAFDNDAVARAAAARISNDQQLYAVTSANVEPGGTSFRWQYQFFSPGLEQVTSVTVDPLVVQVASFPSSLNPNDPPNPIDPEGLLDSNEAIAIADANGGDDFRSQHSSESVFISLTGGNLYDAFPPNSTRLVWRVNYSVPGKEQLAVYLDMADGAVLDPGAVGIEPDDRSGRQIALAQNAPNPAAGTTTIGFVTTFPATVDIALFDVLGRKVLTAADATYPAGDHTVTIDVSGLSAGVYYYRLKAGSQVASRKMIVGH